MSNTVVSVYQDRRAAEQAREGLLISGFPQERIQVATGDTAAMTAEGEDGSVGGKIVHFFSSLFGADQHAQHAQHAGDYAEIVYRGGAVVIVDAANQDEVDRAQAILQQYEPVDVDARRAQ